MKEAFTKNLMKNKVNSHQMSNIVVFSNLFHDTSAILSSTKHHSLYVLPPHFLKLATSGF